MRFTKIPLIATLMAVALSLLIVLPTLAQVSGDRTDGRISVGSWLDVRVADDLDDIGDTDNDNLIGATAFATATTPFDAKDTYFDGNLYVSNQAGKVGSAAHATVANQLAFTEADAYNTILITAAVNEAGGAGVAPLATLKEFDDGFTTDRREGSCDDPRATADDALETGDITTPLAIATIKNLRSNTSVKAYLIDTTGQDTADTAKGIFQGIVAVWDQEDGFDERNGPCGDHGDPQRYIDTTTDNDADNPQLDDGWTATSAAVIPARNGDTLVITVDGVAGSVELIVDGQGPDIDDVTPEQGGTQKSSTVNLGFTVTDDGSGIRYDAESGISGDPDLTPHNGDGDNRFDEPITNKGGAGTDGVAGTADDEDGNGSTMDITVLFDTDDEGDQKAYIANANCATGAGLQTDDAQCLNTDSPAVLVDNTPNPDYTGYRINFIATDDVSQYGSNDWTQRMRGVTYDLDMRLVGKSFGSYFWQITAKDRVGNSAITDADEDEPGDQPFSFKVDDRSPKVKTARTGIGYEPGEGEFKSRSWIALNFENALKNGEFEGGPDRIDAGTVEPGDFTVKGHTVMNVVVPGEKKVCVGDDPTTDKEDESAKNITAFDAGSGKAATDDDGNVLQDAEVPTKCNFEPRARIYLELADALDSDEKPTIQLLGGVLQDIAGNNNVTQSVEGEDVLLDRIAPGVSITVTSSTGTTGRAATDKDGSFTVRVTSDEDLGRFPRLYFATIKGTDPDAANDTIGAATKLAVNGISDSLTLTEKETNVWERKIDADALPGGTDNRIMAVIVTATDEAGNPGNSAGWSDKGAAGPDSGDGLDFKKLNAGNFLVEVDSTIAMAGIKVLPSTDPDNVVDETESANPYIQIDFAEANEYGITADEVAADDTADPDPNPDGQETNQTAYTAAIKDAKPLATDSHPDVTISKLTLNGEDRLDEVVRVKAGRYVLAVTGLEVGEYEISYVATDDVGNEFDSAEEDEDFTFEVLERQPYKVELQPGWNLVSLPGDPFNPAVGNVVGSDLKADTVLGYQSGEWVTAVKNEDGRWQGTLVDIRGGYGYWVRTTAIETIETVIPPILPTSNLPTVPVISGWNLLGVVDAEQDKAGTTHDADEYFTSLNVWRVAYGFETQQNRWAKLLPNGTDGTEPHTVANGKGYWVWSTRPGTLVP